MIDVSFRDYWVSNYHDCRQYDVDEYLHQEEISSRILHRYGFASLKAWLMYRRTILIPVGSNKLRRRRKVIFLL